MKNKINEELKQEVYNLGDEYTILGEYVNTNIKIKMHHNIICADPFYIKPTSRKLKNVHSKNVINKFKHPANNFYTDLDNYINNSTRILMKYKKDGHRYEVEPINFKQRYTCPKYFNFI